MGEVEARVGTPVTAPQVFPMVTFWPPDPTCLHLGAWLALANGLWAGAG